MDIFQNKTKYNQSISRHKSQFLKKGNREKHFFTSIINITKFLHSVAIANYHLLLHTRIIADFYSGEVFLKTRIKISIST